MSFEFYIFFGLLFIYTLLLIVPAIAFLKTNASSPKTKHSDKEISILICARNEEKYLPRCIKTIIEQEYDLRKIQLIIIDDASADQTFKFAHTILEHSKIDHTILRNPTKLGKKKSIIEAMKIAKYEMIITRDADTYTTSKLWLRSISDFQNETESDMIIGPLAISQNSGALWALQAIENNILNLISCGTANLKRPFLCSGANLIFSKAAFYKTNAYQSHLLVESGDDVLFLEDLKRKNGKINYLKNENAFVYTYPAWNIGMLLTQKVRWANKFGANKNFLNFILAMVTFLTNLAMLICMFNGFLVPQNAVLGLIFIGIKLFIDNLLLFLASGFIRSKGLTLYILPVALVYPVYVLSIGIASLFIKPTWK